MGDTQAARAARASQASVCCVHCPSRQRRKSASLCPTVAAGLVRWKGGCSAGRLHHGAATAQAGMSISELGDLIEAHGLHAAIRIAAGKAEQRSRGRRMVAARLVEFYASAL